MCTAFAFVGLPLLFFFACGFVIAAVAYSEDTIKTKQIKGLMVVFIS
jgi:hypothetical protein